MTQTGTRRIAGKRISALGIALLCCALLPAFGGRALADTAVAKTVAAKAAIAVIYPDIGEPYRTAFAQIVGGIEERAKSPLVKYAVRPNVDVAELRSSLRQQEVKVVIALGRQAMQIGATLDQNIGVVVGGVITSPDNELRGKPVNCLSPDPALLFAQLKKLMPGARRVFTVYDSRQNAWLIRLAKEAARLHGLELQAYDAQDLRGAVRAYQEIFELADGARDALWLPQDSTTVEDGSVLPLVLHESWGRNVAVFSSSSGHVRRGVLFSLYPDNIGMGRHLAESAQDFLVDGDYAERGMILLREVLVAINLRTANHLGLDIGREQGFGMVFPAQ